MHQKNIFTLSLLQNCKIAKMQHADYLRFTIFNPLHFANSGKKRVFLRGVLARNLWFFVQNPSGNREKAKVPFNFHWGLRKFGILSIFRMTRSSKKTRKTQKTQNNLNNLKTSLADRCLMQFAWCCVNMSKNACAGTLMYVVSGVCFCPFVERVA